MPPEYNPAIAPIMRYAQAVQSGDVQRIRLAYPGLTSAEQKRWEAVFKEWKVKTSIQRMHGVSSNQAAGTAVVAFEMMLSIIHPTTGSQMSVTRQWYRARLRREGATLSIVGLEVTDGPGNR